MDQRIQKAILIDAPASLVWRILTEHSCIRQWMAEPEMELELFTTWIVGDPIVIKGFHHIRFENRGTVLRFEPYTVLKYNYISSISRLPEKPENYTDVEFRLEEIDDQTSFTVTLRNFPTAVIYKHVDLYWSPTINIIKRLSEKFQNDAILTTDL